LAFHLGAALFVVNAAELAGLGPIRYKDGMRFDQPFIKLPIRFSTDALAAEVRALPKTAWVPHPSGYPGNDAVRLVTPGGQPTDAFEGPMRPTEFLQRCAYVMQIMAELGGVWGRSRLMGLGAGGEVPEHVDAHYHWRTHLRIHVPIITNPAVEFTCGGETVHMAAGECWLFDSFRWHEVHNRGHEHRVHLVLDSVVTDALWDLIEAAANGAEVRELQPGQRAPTPLLFEQLNAPRVMSPWEIRCHAAFVLEQAEPHPRLAAVSRRLDRFADGWSAICAQFGAGDEGIPAYRALLAEGRQDILAAGGDEIKLRNELQLLFVLDQLVFLPAIAVPQMASLNAGGQRLAS